MYSPSLTASRQAFFLPTDNGQRFCVYHPAAGQPQGRVLYIPPFAEEMNKTRRMAALQAQAFAAQGFAVLQTDLFGCGDSSGDFGDATWQQWLDDLQLAQAWLAAHAVGPDWLWGARAGCLLATELGARLPSSCSYLFWQPPSSGKQVLQQFLRLKTVGDMLEGNSSGKGSIDALRRSLQDGHPVEVAGYRVAPSLASGLEASTLAPPARARRLAVCELTTRADATPSPAVQKLVEAWRLVGVQASAQVVMGPAFWQTSEIEDAPELVAAGTNVLRHE